MLELQALAYQPANRAEAVLNGLDLTLKPGEPSALVRAAAARVRLMELICGLASPVAATIRWQGQTAERPPAPLLCGSGFFSF